MIDKIFLLSRKRNNGILELWNNGFECIYQFINFTDKTTQGGGIKPLIHFPRTHHSSSPLFQHSTWPADLWNFIV